MSRVFVDTSAFLALLVETDVAHERAICAFDELRQKEATWVTSSYVLVETYALLARRFGRDAVARFRQAFAPLLEVIWVDRELHEQGVDLMMLRPTSVSLVDSVSFLCIRTRRIDRVFAFDRHFDQEGLVPVI